MESLILIRGRFTQNSMVMGLRPSEVPNAKESKGFWGDIWSIRKGHKQEVE